MHYVLLLKTMKFFFHNPYKEIYLRQLAKELQISPFAVKKYTDFFVKEHLLVEDRKANLRYFKANVNNLFFRKLKVAFSINLILKSKLVDFLKDNFANVSSIILFGSVAKGEDDEKSDIDILVIGKENSLSLDKFEKIIGKEIIIHAFSWAEWNRIIKTDRPFYIDIITSGIPLYGELPVIEWK